MERICERLRNFVTDVKNDKLIEDFMKDCTRTCWISRKFYPDENDEVVIEGCAPQEVFYRLEQILTADFDESYVKCSTFNRLENNIDNIIISVLVDNLYATFHCDYFGYDVPNSKNLQGVVLKLTNRGKRLKKALQSTKTKEQERENCPLL